VQPRNENQPEFIWFHYDLDAPRKNFVYLSAQCVRRRAKCFVWQTMARSRDLRRGLQWLDAAFETQHKKFRLLVTVEAAEQEPATDLSYVALPDFLVAARAVCLGLEVGIVDQDAAEHGSRASASGGRSDNVGRRAKLRR
jgi:hypothetical protein